MSYTESTTIFVILLFLGIAGCTPTPDAEVTKEVPWALISRPLVIDTHSHTRFSDGSLSVVRGTGARQSDLTIELIGNGRSGHPEIISARRLPAGENRMAWKFSDLTPGTDGRSAYFRLRIRKSVPDGPDLLAYTNPIRVLIR